jgi:hypothetical protein
MGFSRGSRFYNHDEQPVRPIDGALVWDLSWPDSAFLGFTTPIAVLYALR